MNAPRGTTPVCGSPAAWIVNTHPNPAARLRLFCFPYAGGGAAAYRLWPGELPASIDVCRVQPPGRETRLREGLYTNLTELVETMAEVLRPDLDMPFAFFGHSLGAMLAFELSRECRRRFGLQPRRLLVSSCRAPRQPRPESIHHLPDDDFIEQLRVRYEGIPEAVLRIPELLELMLPILRADMQMFSTHVHRNEERLDVPITAFGGRDDPSIEPAQLEPWGIETSGRFRRVLFPGKHFYLEGARRQLLDAIADELRDGVEPAVPDR